MKKALAIITLCVGISLWGFISCSRNTLAKKYGGTMTVVLPVNTKLESATWKDEQLWYLYRTRRSNEVLESHTLQEDSRYGLLEGRVVFEEK